MSGHIEDLLAAKAEQDKRIAVLVREVEGLREQMAKPMGNYASAEDVRKLAEVVKEVDRKRMDDAERTHAELLKLRKVLEAPLAPSRRSSSTRSPKDNAVTPTSATPQTGFEYVIKSGDTLDAIVLAYKAKNIKVTVAQILNANPGLKPERLQINPSGMLAIMIVAAMLAGIVLFAMRLI